MFGLARTCCFGGCIRPSCPGVLDTILCKNLFWFPVGKVGTENRVCDKLFFHTFAQAARSLRITVISCGVSDFVKNTCDNEVELSLVYTSGRSDFRKRFLGFQKVMHCDITQ